jgi:hypothetical protein
MQCRFRLDLLNTKHDINESSVQRSDAALNLSFCAAAGYGCEKSIDEMLNHLYDAAEMGSVSAQIVYHRVFATHHRTPRKLERPESASLSESLGDSEEFAKDGLGPSKQNADSDDDFEMGEPSPASSKQDIEEMDSDSEGEGDSTYVVADLSAALDKKIEQEDAAPSCYYLEKVRMMEDFLGQVRAPAPLLCRGKLYQGITDEKLLPDVRGIWQTEGIVPPLEVKVMDGSLYEVPILHHAIVCNMASLADELLELGVSPESRDIHDGDTALQVACCYGRAQLTELLLHRGAKAAVVNSKSKTPLHYLWMFGENEIERIADAMIAAGADINASMGRFDTTTDDKFYFCFSDTPLHTSVALRNKKAVEVLIERGADVNKRPFENSLTALETAVQLHLPEIVELLIHHGATLYEKGRAGKWAMHYVGRHVRPITRYMESFFLLRKRMADGRVDGFFTVRATNKLQPKQFVCSCEPRLKKILALIVGMKKT